MMMFYMVMLMIRIQRGAVLGGPKRDILVLDVRSVKLYQGVH
jgi:hypothetical protein